MAGRKTSGTNTWIIVAVLAAIALYSAFVWVESTAESRLLAAEGVQAEATVEAKSISTSRGKNGQKRTTHNVWISFKDAKGAEHRVETVVSASGYDRLHEGKRVEIIYAASNPEVLEIERGSLGQSARLAGWAGVIFGAAAAAFAALGVLVQRKRTQRR